MLQQTDNQEAASSAALDSFFADIRRMAAALEAREAEAKNAPEPHPIAQIEKPPHGN